MNTLQDNKLTPEDNKRLTKFLNDLQEKAAQQRKDFDQLWGDRPDIESQRDVALEWFMMGWDLAEQRAKPGMAWIKVTDDIGAKLPQEDEVVLVFSPIDGIGLATLERPYGVTRRWVWIHKTINGASLANNVSYWCRVELPKVDR